MEIVQNLFRTIMFFLDNIIYGLIPQIYKLFIYLSELNLFSEDPNSPIQRLVNHIYVLLGIFMLFKVSFSLLQYIVDPNSFRDSSKGMGKLVTNVLVALVLLVSVPSIFNLAMNIQTEIVQSNAIGQLILGTSAGSNSYPVNTNGSINDEGVEQMARDLQFMLYGAFYSINPTVMEEGRILEACSGSSGVLGSTDMAETKDCLDSLQDNLPDDATSNGVSLYSFFKYQDSNGEIQDERDFSHFDKLLWWKDEGVYVVNYLPFISALAGIYVVFLLISFCVDIAVRAIKLCFLQMLAPIAIVSYVDPKESISKGKLNAWIKECASTYFSLFLRLATIFLVMFLISMISSTLLSDGGYISGMPEDKSYNIWIYLFLVIGAFMFAKQVPNIIEKIFGIKGSGELSLNPFKSIGEVLTTPAIAAGGAAVGGAVGGATANAIAAGKQLYDNRFNIRNGLRTGVSNMKGIAGSQHMTFGNKAKAIAGIAGGGALTAARGAFRGVGTVAAGGISAGARGVHAGYTNKDMLKGANAGRMGATEARNERDIRQTAGYGVKDRVLDAAANFANIKNKAGGVGAMDQQIKEWTRARENAQVKEHSMRDAQSSMISTTGYTTADMERAMFTPKLDEKGQQLINPVTNQPVWDNDPDKIRTYEEYRNYALGSGISENDLIDEKFYNEYSSTEHDALLADQEAEQYRKAIKDYQDVMDIDKKGKK